MSVRTKLILISLSLSVVPLAALTFFSYTNSLRSMRNLVERENRVAAEQIQDRVASLSDGIQERIAAITELPEMQVLTPGSPLTADQSARLAQAMQSEVGESWSLFSDLQFQPAVVAVDHRRPSLPSVARELPGDLDEVLAPLIKEAEAAVAEGEAEVWSMKVILPDFSALDADDGEAAPTVRQYQLDFVDGVPTTQTMEALTGEMVENMVRLPGFLLQTGESGEIRLRNLGQEMRQELMDEAAAGTAALVEEQQNLNRQVEVLRRFDAQADEASEVIVLPVNKPEGEVGSVIARIRPDRVLAQVFQGVPVGDQEIAFAVDPRGNVHTRRPEDMAVLEDLGLASMDPQGGQAHAASTDPRELSTRTEQSDWISVIQENEETGYVFGVVRQVSDELRTIRSAALLNLFLGFAFIGMAGSGVIVFSHRMTHGLEALTDGARRIAAGDLHHRILARRKDELGQLAAAFNDMAGDLEKSRRNLLEQERVRRELEIARSIQRDSLPREPFTSKDLQIFGRSIPSNEVGGDFYNFLPVPGGRIAILVGDVSGKGVPAALLMAEVQATLRTLLQYQQDVSRVMSQLNLEVCQTKPDNVYLTLFLGLLEVETGEFTYVNAGHTPPFIVRAESGETEFMAATARPTGLFEDAPMPSSSIQVSTKDILCIYTDGVAESAEVDSEEFFGAERIEAAVRSCFDANLPHMLDEVSRRLTSFHGEEALEDDATLVLVRVTGQQEALKSLPGRAEGMMGETGLPS